MAKLEDVIQNLIDTNQKLINGEIDVKIAEVIVKSTQTLLNAGRLQLDIMKFTTKPQKFIQPTSDYEDAKRLVEKAEVKEKEEKLDNSPFPFNED